MWLDTALKVMAWGPMFSRAFFLRPWHIGNLSQCWLCGGIMAGNAGSTLEALLLSLTTSCTIWLCVVLYSGAAMLSASVVIHLCARLFRAGLARAVGGMCNRNISGMQHQGLLGSGLHNGGQQRGRCQARSHMNPSVLRVWTNKQLALRSSSSENNVRVITRRQREPQRASSMPKCTYPHRHHAPSP